MRKNKCFCLASLAILATSGLVSCGGNGTEEEKPNEDDTPTIKYQFSGHYTDETLTGYGYDWYILLNLYSDGSAKGSGYNTLSMDSSAYDKNTGFREKWYVGKWKEAVNEEELSYIDLNLSYSSDAINDMGGTTLAGSFEYEIYSKADKSMTFTVDVPVFSGRKQEITGNTEIKYKDYNEFIQKNLYTREEPSSIAIFDNNETGKSRLYVQDKGEALCYTGKEDPATKEVKYVISGKWTWRKDGTKLIFNNGSVDLEVVVDGKKGTIEYEQSLMGHTVKYKYVCEDITPILNATGGTSGETEENKKVAEFVSADGSSTLTLFSDKTAKLVAYGGMLKPTFNWKYENNKLTFVDAQNPQKKMEATIEGNKAKVTYKDNLGGNEIVIELSCEDISSIIG